MVFYYYCFGKGGHVAERESVFEAINEERIAVKDTADEEFHEESIGVVGSNCSRVDFFVFWRRIGHRRARDDGVSEVMERENGA